VVQLIARMSSSNMFWMNQTQGGTRDPARLAAIPGIIADIRSTTPAELQALATKYLVPAKDWSMVVVPEKK
jgi:zinc protease